MTEEKNTGAPEQEMDLSEQRLIRRAKLKELQDAGEDPFQITKYVVTARSADVKEKFEEMEGKQVSVAGRIMSKRGMGKAVFCDLQDGKGRIQLYVRIDELGEEAFAKFKKTDIGDIVGVEGEVFKTKRGEISVKAHKVTLLSKSLQPLPEKFHGLTDKEMRYRQRYVDLIMNEDVRRTFRIRTAFIKHMRRYLDERDYLEVETPVLNTISGGATARPFITHHNTLDIDMYMRIATELNLKRLTVGGFERVYEIGRIFRNEGMDPKHNPEFTTIELYEAYADFHDMMDIAEGILSSAALELLGGYEDGTFRPDNTVTRAEFCAMAATALALPADHSVLDQFSDVSAQSWYADGISAMADMGVISGYGDGTFRPDSTITYQEMVTILSAVAAWANMNIYDLSQQEVSAADWATYYEYAPWAQAPARNLASLDALVGDLAPADLGTRQVAAGMLYQIMEGIGLLWD